MSTVQRHRKRVRHYDEAGQGHELTFSCYQGSPLLTSSVCRRLLSESIDRAVSRLGWDLVAFVYMPEHVHLIVFPVSTNSTVAGLLFAIRRPVSTRIKQQRRESDPKLLRSLTIRERPEKQAFRFWQEGGGYDRNIASNKVMQTAIDDIHHNPVRRGLCDSPAEWQWSSWSYYFDHERWPRNGLPAVHGFDS